MNTRPEPVATSPSTFKLATPAPELVTASAESDELVTSKAKAVADFWMVVVLLPRMILPDPESNVRLLDPIDEILTEPALAAVWATWMKWVVPFAPWTSKMLPDVAVPDVCIIVVPELFAVGANVLDAFSRAMFVLSDRLDVEIAAQLPPDTSPPVAAKEDT